MHRACLLTIALNPAFAPVAVPRATSSRPSAVEIGIQPDYQFGGFPPN
jgi:hypothetical protein